MTNVGAIVNASQAEIQCLCGPLNLTDVVDARDLALWPPKN